MSDIIDDLIDLHKQATTERSHYYTAKVVERSIAEIKALRSTLEYQIPCDVNLPPNTTIKKGCSLKTLIVGLIARERVG